MPLPLILGIGAIVAGSFGVGAGIAGACELSDAKKKVKNAKARDEINARKFKAQNDETCKIMDQLGELELKILSDFKTFSNLFARIKNAPRFENIDIQGFKVPRFTGEDINKVAVGAAVLLSGSIGAALGTLGGMAASSATTAAVMALGTASTGTAIASLSGVAATNATLAAIGGGSLAAGGGGMALGSTILGASTLGVGLLIGGIIFAIAGCNTSDKADKAWRQMLENERTINKICDHLSQLAEVAKEYKAKLEQVNRLYIAQLYEMKRIISNDTNWSNYSPSERLVIENTVLLVGVLYNMCKVKLVLKVNDQENRVNKEDTAKNLQLADEAISKVKRSHSTSNIGATPDKDTSNPAKAKSKDDKYLELAKWYCESGYINQAKFFFKKSAIDENNPVAKEWCVRLGVKI